MGNSSSIFARKRYGVERVCTAWAISRSTVYYGLKSASRSELPQKRGPKTTVSDQELLMLIQQIIKERSQVGFHGEGYRKILFLLRKGNKDRKQVRVAQGRLLRIMGENDLLSPYRWPHRPAKVHDGKITTDAPDIMWGTDMTSIPLITGRKGYVYAVVDHCTQECLGFHVAGDADRYSTFEAVKMAVENVRGNVKESIAFRTILRHDCGSSYLSDYFQNEVRYLGLKSSPAFVRQPQGNGVVERFFKTLKEQLLWLHMYSSVEDLYKAVAQWIKNYNEHWMVQKNMNMSPADSRAKFVIKKVA